MATASPAAPARPLDPRGFPGGPPPANAAPPGFGDGPKPDAGPGFGFMKEAIAYVPYPDAPRRLPMSAEGLEKLAATRVLRQELRDREEEIEQLKRLPDDLIERMGAIGHWLMGAPELVGGGIDYPLQFRILEELGSGTASAGWCVLTHLASSDQTANLSLDAARKIWSKPATVLAGTPAPGGRALRVPGGYQVIDGSWAWSTNSEHAHWFMGGLQIVDSIDEPGLQMFAPPTDGGMPLKMPRMMVAFFPRSDVDLVRGSWDSIGMRASGSGKYAVTDKFVPDEMIIDMMMMMHNPNKLKTIGPVGIGGHASVLLGVARHALELFYELAKHKRPVSFGNTSLLSERPLVQNEIGKAEAKLRAARSYFFEVIDDAWARWSDGEKMSKIDTLNSNIANVHAARTAKEVVQTVFELAGTTSVFQQSPLERVFRDAMTAQAHMSVQEYNYATFGAALAGHPVTLMG